MRFAVLCVGHSARENNEKMFSKNNMKTIFEMKREWSESEFGVEKKNIQKNVTTSRRSVMKKNWTFRHDFEKKRKAQNWGCKMLENSI